MTKATHYAQFDNMEVAGKFYALGDAIDDDVHPAVIQVLVDQGRIADSQPSTGVSVPTETVAIDDMNRVQLEQAVLAGSKTKMAEMSDDELRDTARRLQTDEEREAEEKAKADAEKAQADADASSGGENADADANADDADKPPRTRKRAEG